MYVICIPSLCRSFLVMLFMHPSNVQWIIHIFHCINTIFRSIFIGAFSERNTTTMCFAMRACFLHGVAVALVLEL